MISSGSCCDHYLAKERSGEAVIKALAYSAVLMSRGTTGPISSYASPGNELYRPSATTTRPLPWSYRSDTSDVGLDEPVRITVSPFLRRQQELDKERNERLAGLRVVRRN